MRSLLESARNLAPVLLVIAFFQTMVIGDPLPDLNQKALGFACVLIGLTVFVRGLAISLFPIGEGLAHSLAERGSVLLLLAFAFSLGFGSTFAEPALGAVIATAAEIAAADGLVTPGPDGTRRFAAALRFGISGGVGLGVAIGSMRIVLGWPATPLVLGGYGAALLLALGAPAAVGGVAFDAGAAATSAINIPLIMALGVGIASVMQGRNPMIDGFGLVAFASVMPVIAVLLGAYAMLPLR
jgi:hypothetical protein